ncbi:uncharacterized protein LOC128985628 isoform X2 [Macrosteles quadrilineatus]|uniref:uncharacterized protein LOC128985628 isoform X2 n=1 Tax=Macrosteles quadrilineatus TaxID=74068 RepID=UPI0023E245E2|nr:uncharacterized protein LOC128985628 isoform X2 [Macrosteles quadrilineatus]
MPRRSCVIMSAVKKSFGSRKFYALPEDYAIKSSKLKSQTLVKKEDSTKLIKYIDDNIIGKNTTFAGPFGRRKVVYCDYTASGRSLQFIEDYILREVLPLYGNTHTTTTITSMQSTLFRHEARDVVRNAVHASEEDVVIFAGHGCTGAVHKLIHALSLDDPPIVFVGPCEHHSNLLPWRELGAKIVRISETKEGFLDLVDLENQLQFQRTVEGDRTLIGCFSAASNITGILADDIATTLLLHQYGALAFWDYATAAPYVQLDMNPLLPGVNEKAVYKDAMFFSGHKFVGGVQTPGILVAKKSLFVNSVPQGCGGGTVFFVTASGHKYLKDVEMREEGGTAAIVESIRAGLAMQLKMTVGVANIMAREEKITKLMLSHLRKIPEIILLGNGSQSAKRLAVFSFLVRHPRGTFLHHNFVCAVLNDVFGIQARGGCACAGPYAQDLLGIDEDLAQEYETILLEDENLDRHHLRRHEEHSSYEMLRPGFTRLSLPYHMAEPEVLFVMEAVKMVATEGWKLLPQYVVNPETGEWRHHSNSVFRERKWLGQIRYVDGKMAIHERKVSGVASCPTDYSECLQTARNIFNKARKMAQRYPLGDQCVMFNEETNHLRWFMLPSEAQDLLLGNCINVKTCVPFTPSDYAGSRGGENSPIPLTTFSRHKSLSSLEIKLNNAKTDMRSRADSFSPQTFTGARERCYSLGGDTLPRSRRERQISCSSQTDGSEQPARMSSATPPVVVTTTNNPQHLQAYMHEVSMSLATEIKSEIREVINRVEDVLSSESADESCSNHVVDGNAGTPSVVINPPVFDLGCNQQSMIMQPSCMQPLTVQMPVGPAPSLHRAFSSPNTSVSYFQTMDPSLVNNSPQSSISADHVAECLAELTGEMVSELKSEIREMVSQVDELISPSSESGRTNSPEAEEPRPRLSEEDSSLPDVVEVESLASIAEGVEDCHKLKFKDARRSTVNSISSQDSGINLSYHERDSSPADTIWRRNGHTNETREMNKKAAATNKKVELCTLVCKRDQENELADNLKQNLAKPRWHCPPKNIWKPTTDAIKEFNMIQEGDRVLVCLSGGKDSLSLLHTLHQYQYYANSKGLHFTLGAATVDPGSSAYNPRPLIPYLQALGVHYLYEEQSILDAASSVDCKSICSFCSRMKRGRLYAAARREGYNVLALGQHLDDLAESFLMSTFHNGRLRSMKAHYYIRERDLRVCRPFVYVRERSLRQFAESRHLPVIPENCPACFEAPKERYRTKQLLAQQEILFPRLFLSLRAALKPLISFRATGEESKAYSKGCLGPDDLSDTDTEEEPAPVLPDQGSCP